MVGDLTCFECVGWRITGQNLWNFGDGASDVSWALRSSCWGLTNRGVSWSDLDTYNNCYYCMFLLVIHWCCPSIYEPVVRGHRPTNLAKSHLGVFPLSYYHLSLSLPQLLRIKSPLFWWSFNSNTITVTKSSAQRSLNHEHEQCSKPWNVSFYTGWLRAGFSRTNGSDIPDNVEKLV